MFLKKVFFMFLVSAISLSGFAVELEGLSRRLSFSGVESINAIKAGELTKTIRRYDRTISNTDPANKSQYDLGQFLPLVNSNQEEDERRYEEQIQSGEYGAAKVVKLQVVKFDDLSAQDQEEVLLWNSPEKLAEAGGILTVIEFVWEPIEL